MAMIDTECPKCHSVACDEDTAWRLSSRFTSLKCEKCGAELISRRRRSCLSPAGEYMIWLELISP